MKKIHNNITNNEIEVGIDEAGRGPLIGRVYVGCVNWGNTVENKDVMDSKKMTPKKRESVFKWIESNVDDWAVGYADETEIDNINILQATKLAITRSLEQLDNKPNFLIIDGINWDFENYNVTSIVKGDSKYYSIAAASIIAKVYHDRYIKELCKENPELNERYDLLKNMGYGTKKHIEGIKKYGLSKFHRKTFKIKQLN